MISKPEARIQTSSPSVPNKVNVLTASQDYFEEGSTF